MVRPVGSENSVSPRFEEGQGGEQFFTKIEQAFALHARKLVIVFANGRRRRRGINARLGSSALLREVATSTRDGESFVIEEALDFKDGFDIFAAIHAMAAGAFHRLQRGEFSLPIAQNERFCRC